MPDEFPKMLTTRVGNRIVPVVYPPKHVRHGQHVVFADAAEEKVYKGGGIPVTAPEQVGQQIGYPIYMLPD